MSEGKMNTMLNSLCTALAPGNSMKQEECWDVTSSSALSKVSAMPLIAYRMLHFVYIVLVLPLSIGIHVQMNINGIMILIYIHVM